ncbi:MAG: hypothetical protein COB12_08810 [Flavobacterium sp.]|nr:MAG: hypothetical protein COB12_08810 [Flavobacterium sp.]
MKKIILLFSILFITQFSYSQVFVEDVDINELDIKYIQLIGVNTSMFGVKFKVFVDYGQKAKMMKADGIKDSEGETKKFNTMIDALNFMHSNGWKYINYTEAEFSGKIRYVYLLEKK